MFNKYHVGSCNEETELGYAFIFKYYLTETQKKISRKDSSVTVTSYGIDISCEKLIDGGIKEGYEEVLDCVSPCREKVMNLIEILKKHVVSPVHLVDIAGPYADEWVSDYDHEADVILNATFLV